jgi:hypothetical protein
LYIDCCGISWPLVSSSTSFYSYKDSRRHPRCIGAGRARTQIPFNSIPEGTELDPEPTDKGDTHMEYSSHWLHIPSTGTIIKITWKNSGQHRVWLRVSNFPECLIVKHLSRPMDARILLYLEG